MWGWIMQDMNRPALNGYLSLVNMAMMYFSFHIITFLGLNMLKHLQVDT